MSLVYSLTLPVPLSVRTKVMIHQPICAGRGGPAYESVMIVPGYKSMTGPSHRSVTEAMAGSELE